MTKVGDEVLLNPGMAVNGVREGVVSSVNGDDIYINVKTDHGTVEAHRYPCEFTVTKEAPPPIETPEHDKLKALAGQNQIVGDFIQWISEKNLTICEWSDEGNRYCPIFKSTETILSEYFEIDLAKLEEEKRAILQRLRNQSDPVSK